jgi:Glutaredoxin and related proteins
MSKLTLFTLPNCQPCIEVKPRFTAEMEKHGREYEILNVLDNMVRVRELGITSAPTLVDDGKVVAVGPKSIMAYVTGKFSCFPSA